MEREPWSKNKTDLEPECPDIDEEDEEDQQPHPPIPSNYRYACFTQEQARTCACVAKERPFR